MGRDELFELHTDPVLFEVLTPPGMGQVTISHSFGIQPGSEAAIRVSHPLLAKLPHIPIPGYGTGPIGLPWRVRHTVLDAPSRFEDVQVSGPFASWRHVHEFREAGAYRTTITDTVHWSLPLILRPLRPLIARTLASMFEYREQALREYIRQIQPSAQ